MGDICEKHNVERGPVSGACVICVIEQLHAANEGMSASCAKSDAHIEKVEHELKQAKQERDENYKQMGLFSDRVEKLEEELTDMTKELNGFKTLATELTKERDGFEKLFIDFKHALYDCQDKLAIDRKRADDEKAMAGAEIGRAEHLLNQLGVERTERIKSNEAALNLETKLAIERKAHNELREKYEKHCTGKF